MLRESTSIRKKLYKSFSWVQIAALLYNIKEQNKIYIHTRKKSYTAENGEKAFHYFFFLYKILPELLHIEILHV